MSLLEVPFFGAVLKNPFMAASGTFGYGELLEKVPLPFGLIVTKGISRDPMPGNEPPRIFELEGGMLNRIGLQNIGLEAFVRDVSPFLERLGIPYMVNILGFSVDDFVYMYREISKTGALAVELNVSCPNVEKGGIAFSNSPELLRELSLALKEEKGKPISVKLPPVVSAWMLELFLDIFEPVSSCYTVSNTYPSTFFDWKRGRFFDGGFSGPSIRYITLKMVREVVKRTEKPVIASGGVMDGKSALEYFMAGAKFVQIGTANLIDPMSIVRIVDEVTSYLESRNIPHIWKVAS